MLQSWIRIRAVAVFALCALCLACVGHAENGPPRLVPEILSLEDLAVIPAYLFARYDTRSLAESIVYRIHVKDEIRLGIPYDDLPLDFMRDADIYLHLLAANFPNIQAKFFLNQHQTGTTRGSLAPEMRDGTEQSLMGLRLEETYYGHNGNPAHVMRPKYALLHFTDAVHVGRRGSNASGYGDVVSVLKPEVKRRATWTYSDSLGLSRSIPKWRRKWMGTFYRGSIQKWGTWCYSEAQVYGELDLCDVDHFLVPNESFVTLLEAAGLPIYEKKSVQRQNRQDYEHGKLLCFVQGRDRGEAPPRRQRRFRGDRPAGSRSLLRADGPKERARVLAL